MTATAGTAVWAAAPLNVSTNRTHAYIQGFDIIRIRSYEFTARRDRKTDTTSRHLPTMRIAACIAADCTDQEMNER